MKRSRSQDARESLPQCVDHTSALSAHSPSAVAIAYVACARKTEPTKVSFCSILICRVQESDAKE